MLGQRRSDAASAPWTRSFPCEYAPHQDMRLLAPSVRIEGVRGPPAYLLSALPECGGRATGPGVWRQGSGGNVASTKPRVPFGRFVRGRMSVQDVKHKRLVLKQHPGLKEKWVQGRIRADPGL